LIAGGADWTLFSEWMKPGEIPSIEMIERSSMIKSQISSTDEKESSHRMVLNFGHTIGHALEAYFLQKGQPETHGACVALGMMVEIRIAMDLHLTGKDFGEYLIQFIHQAKWFGASSIPDFRDISGYLANDKKIREGHFNLIAFTSPGVWTLFKTSEMKSIEKAYQTLK
jgi:3-dehydroquinate synthase